MGSFPVLFLVCCREEIGLKKMLPEEVGKMGKRMREV